ncbi:hypothetical protein BN381_610016 [Candidatus Microthrix parvicella RN1]|uniref:Uncharacterized protein n=1 Tax=Candidatus Neomicrothrix parvicella RN1 TaxID=1229780 RepID=R4Z7B0_9ACTN|nr:hypothetical protein BN381_610016 [Candidatus Microthrix parvicella RN1]
MCGRVGCRPCKSDRPCSTPSRHDHRPPVHCPSRRSAVRSGPGGRVAAWWRWIPGSRGTDQNPAQQLRALELRHLRETVDRLSATHGQARDIDARTRAGDRLHLRWPHGPTWRPMLPLAAREQQTLRTHELASGILALQLERPLIHVAIQPSMLPRSTYGSSLRTVIEPDGWQRLRRAAGRTT